MAIDIDASTSVSSARNNSLRAHIYTYTHRLYLFIERNSVLNFLHSFDITSTVRICIGLTSDALFVGGKISITDKKNSQAFYEARRGEFCDFIVAAACKSSIKQELCAKCIR